jgi:hypothetical protein
LIIACFKDVNLENESYTSLRNRNKELMDNIAGEYFFSLSDRFEHISVH